MPVSNDRLEVFKFRLEIVKTVIGGILTVGVFLVGYFLQHRDQVTAVEQAQAIEHRKSVVAERIKKYDEIAPLMNDVYCYFEFVGKWKEFTPETMIEHKRELDRVVCSYSILFDSKFLAAYKRFMDETYQPFGGWARDARLRTSGIRPNDRASTGASFTGEDNRASIYDAYWELQKQAAEELDANLTTSNSQEQRDAVLNKKPPSDVSNRGDH